VARSGAGPARSIVAARRRSIRLEGHCVLSTAQSERVAVPTTKGSKDNEKDVRDGEDRSRRRPNIIVHVLGVGHAGEQRTSSRVAAIIPITCILFVILRTLRRGDLVLASAIQPLNL